MSFALPIMLLLLLLELVDDEVLPEGPPLVPTPPITDPFPLFVVPDPDSDTVPVPELVPFPPRAGRLPDGTELVDDPVAVEIAPEAVGVLDTLPEIDGAFVC